MEVSPIGRDLAVGLFRDPSRSIGWSMTISCQVIPAIFLAGAMVAADRYQLKMMHEPGGCVASKAVVSSVAHASTSSRLMLLMRPESSRALGTKRDITWHILTP